MKFKATKKAYFNDSMINAGDEFEADDDFKASWAVKAEEFAEEDKPDDEQLAKEAREGLQGSKEPKKKTKKKSKKKVAKKG